MTPQDALSAIAALAPTQSAALEAPNTSTKSGVPAADLDLLVRDWRATLDLETRISLADALWQTPLEEARVAAAKLLTQARIRPDDSAVWQRIADWGSDLNSRATADALAVAGQKRLVADPNRLDQMSNWATAPNPWVRRALFVMTLPWAAMRNPKPQDLDVQAQVIVWATALARDPSAVVQTALGAWVIGLTRHDPEQVQAFMTEHGAGLPRHIRDDITKTLQRNTPNLALASGPSLA